MAILTFGGGFLPAHPMPDIPVHTEFDRTGTAELEVELDPRCFEEDPENALYLFTDEFEALSTEEQGELLEAAREYLPTVLAFEFDPGGPVRPEFTFRFEARSREEFEVEEEIMVILAEATVPVPANTNGYRIRALDKGYLTVLVFNELNGKKAEGFQALFPSETSHWLALKADAVADKPVATRPGASLLNWIGGTLAVALILFAGWATMKRKIDAGRSTL